DKSSPDHPARVAGSHDHLLISSLARRAWRLGTLSDRISVRPLVGETCGKSSTSAEAQGGRIGASPFREGALGCAGSRKQRHHAVISLVTPRLGIDSIRLVALSLQFVRGSPRFRPHGRILYRHGVLDRIRVDACPPFDEMPLLVGPLTV